jgi:purine-binding chemotaxis protein CheW
MDDRETNRTDSDPTPHGASAGPVPTRGEYCVFLRGPLAIGVSTQVVREVLDARPCTPIPLAPADLLGAFNLRGEIVPLVQLDRLLGVKPSPYEHDDAVLVLADGDLTFAVVIDVVAGIKHIPPWQIEPPDPTARELSPLARGTAMVEGREIVVLDSERVFAAVAGEVSSAFLRRVGRAACSEGG